MDFHISLSSHFDNNVDRPRVQLVKLQLLCYNSVDQPSSLSYSREMSWEINQFLSSHEACLNDLFVDTPLPSNSGENYRDRVMSLARQVNGRPDVPILRMVFEAYRTPDQDDIDVGIDALNFDFIMNFARSLSNDRALMAAMIRVLGDNHRDDTRASMLREPMMYMRSYGVNAPAASKDFIEMGLERFVWGGADNNMDDVHESHQCVVCVEEYSEVERVVVGRMPCGHVFHLDCITKWLNVRNSCPLCRFEVPTSDDILNL